MVGVWVGGLRGWWGSRGFWGSRCGGGRGWVSGWVRSPGVVGSRG